MIKKYLIASVIWLVRIAISKHESPIDFKVIDLLPDRVRYYDLKINADFNQLKPIDISICIDITKNSFG